MTRYIMLILALLIAVFVAVMQGCSYGTYYETGSYANQVNEQDDHQTYTVCEKSKLQEE